MGFSNYPDGFLNGITVRGVPILNTYAGNVFWVDSNIGSNGNNGKLPGQPFATLDYTVGKCTANNGDIILIAPGHTETLIADSGVDIDIAGIAIIGLGKGEDRPIFTFTTAATADFKIAAANVVIANLVFKCNIANQDMMIEVSGDDAEIASCEFREGSATGLNFITIGTADADSDRCFIHDCKFHMPTAGNGDSAISFAKDHTGVVIERNNIYGDFDLAGIDIPAGGNAQVDLVIRDNIITNLLTGQHAIQINGTGSTGKIIKCYVETDALSTSIDAGGLEMFECYYHDGTDQVGWTPVAVEPDSVANILGADDNNNGFASTNVARNKDGSVLERLEDITAELSGAAGIATFPAAAAAANGVSLAEVIRYMSELQIPRIDLKTTGDLTASGTSVALFTVTGDVLCKVGGSVDVAVTCTSGTTTAEVGVAGNTASLCVQDVIDGTAFDVGDSWSLITAADANAAQMADEWVLIGNGANIIMTVSVDDITAGDIDFYCQYIPLTSGSSVAAA